MQLIRISLASLLLLVGLPVSAQETSLAATAVIRGDQDGRRIDRHLYGQFAEHLGRCIYEGIWVGEDSTIPNTRGIRNDVVAALKQLQVPVLRWPGGCFADDYHWRDGIGPRDQRPKRINIHWGNVVETNAFGTHEFLDLCEQIGADPYLAGNVGSGSPQELRDWVEYLTYDGDSALANLRRQNGRDKPWRINYIGVGNENWGCGGNMRPEHYADLYRNFATYLRDFSGSRLTRVACGPNGGDTNWTKVVMNRAAGQMQALSLHYYTVAAPWEAKLAATGFGEAQWFAILHDGRQMDRIIRDATDIMDRVDPEKRIGLFVDEWGAWYRDTPHTSPLYQQNSLRDALLAAETLHIFQEHADRVRMANIAQTVNVLQAMILTDGPKMLLTPSYHAFEMLKVHQDATRLPVVLKSPEYRVGDRAMPALSVSASRDKSGVTHVSIVNVHATRPVALTCELPGVKAAKVAGRLLTSEKLDAHNTFESPDEVKPQAFAGATLEGGKLRATLPAHSLVVLELSS
jgi:alpha-N-arabinofuranosidase